MACRSSTSRSRSIWAWPRSTRPMRKASTSIRSTRWRTSSCRRNRWLSIPDMGKRFWVMQIIDAWNNVPHAPGSRTVGSKGGRFALVVPTWKGTLSEPGGLAGARIPADLTTTPQYALRGPVQAGSCSSRSTPYSRSRSAARAGAERVLTRRRRRTTSRQQARRTEDERRETRQPTLGTGCDRRIGRSREVRRGDRGRRSRGIKAMRETVRGKVVNGWQIALDMGRYGTKYRVPGRLDFFRRRRQPDRGRRVSVCRTRQRRQAVRRRDSYSLDFTRDAIPPVRRVLVLREVQDDGCCSSPTRSTATRSAIAAI